ncbi:MAG: TIGR00159 family protein [Candidatus Coatesbacteria bacterium]|nr:MAG: TIGR00159 family protein [Candidatus Coatesbacteria bacterium]
MHVDIFSLLSDFFRSTGYIRPSWTDVIDIIVVALVVYFLLKLIKGTFAVQMIVGLVFMIAASLIARLAGLRTINMLLSNFWSFGLLVFLVIFQPEIRRTLAQLGKYGLMRHWKAQQTELVEEIVKAASALSQSKTGALIVIERSTGLRSFIEHGVPIGAAVTSPLLRAIFQKASPLHDGAVIISAGVIASAVSFLPLIKSRDLDMSFGSRHRAAMGVTEDTDAVAVLVSEETGAIHLAINGKLTKRLEPDQLRNSLKTLMVNVRGSSQTMLGKRKPKTVSVTSE